MLPIAQKIRPFTSSSWADGATSLAPRGRPQYPSLLAPYGPNRPPWNVAGVDYRVGVPEGLSLRDWQTLPQSGVPISANLVSGQVFMSADYIFLKIDFSTGVGGYIYNPSGNANNITVKNCKFGFPSWNPTTNNPFFINSQNDLANVTIIKTIFNGLYGGQSAAVSSNGSLKLQYNWFLNGAAHVAEINITTGSPSVIYQYNLLDNMQIGAGSHMNYMQIQTNGTHTMQVTVDFNTTYQIVLDGAEGFQFEGGGVSNPTTYPNATFRNNTMITRPSNPQFVFIPPPTNAFVLLGPQVMSYMLHGNGGGSATVTNGLNTNNYFDTSGAFNAYFPATMGVSSGWTYIGNTNMITSAPIIPT